MHIIKCWSGTCPLLLRHDYFIWKSVQSSTVMLTRTTNDQKPNFDLPCLPPLSQRERQILQVTEKQNQSLANVQEHSKKMYSFSLSSNTMPQPTFFSSDQRLPGRWAKSQELNTHLQRWLPKIIKTSREIFWLISFEVLWMKLRSIHRTWKVWRMFPKIIASVFFFYTKSVALRMQKSKLCRVKG